MSKIIKAGEVKPTNYVAIDFGPTIGFQWVKVEQVDIDLSESEAVVLSVRMGKRFGSRYLEEFFQIDQLIACQTAEEFESFLNLYKLEH